MKQFNFNSRKPMRMVIRSLTFLVIIGLLIPSFSNLQAATVRLSANSTDSVAAASLYKEAMNAFRDDVSLYSASEVNERLVAYHKKVAEYGLNKGILPTHEQAQELLNLLPFTEVSINASKRLVSHGQVQLGLDLKDADRFIMGLEAEVALGLEDSDEFILVSECSDACADSFGISVGISMAIAVVVLALCGFAGPLAAPCAVAALEGMGLAFGGDVIGLLICLARCPDDEVHEG